MKEEQFPTTMEMPIIKGATSLTLAPILLLTNQRIHSKRKQPNHFYKLSLQVIENFIKERKDLAQVDMMYTRETSN